MTIPERMYIETKKVVPGPGSDYSVLVLYELRFKPPSYSLLLTNELEGGLGLLIGNSFTQSKARSLFRRISSEEEFLQMREHVGSDEEL